MSETNNTVPPAVDEDETATEESAVPAQPVAEAPRTPTAPASSPSAGDDPTRLASDAEIADLRRIRAAGPTRRRTVLTLISLLLVGFIAAVVAHFLSRQETTISYPHGSDVRRLVNVGNVALLVYWPGDARTVVRGDGSNRLDVVTGVGRERSVPMHLMMTHAVLTNGLVATTRESYDAWVQAHVASGWNFDASSESLVYVNESASGYPAWAIDYERTAGKARFAGRVLYVRHIDHEVVLVREFPSQERPRAEFLLDNYRCLAANQSAVTDRFEVPAKREPGDPADLLTLANAEVLSNFLGSDWPQVDAVMRTILVETRERRDTAMTRRATELYQTFRRLMQHWYLRECLEFLQARDTDEDDNVRKMTQAGIRTRIRREAATRLPQVGDCRQMRIAKDDWSIE